MKKKNSHHGKARKSQVSKPAKSANRDYMYAMQDLRRSSATSPVPSGKAYRRPAPGKRWE